ncbi:MAG: glycosyltransferase [Rhodospirillaceae bacterium]|nr:MAG: glycosyltransferase [Rhodospirillaceae bacterium]
MPEISIVIPAHNEATNIDIIYSEISKELSKERIEVIFVDDGSTDKSVGQILELKSKHSNVRLVRLSRNFGHQAALMAGIASASGKAIITMDCDMQHSPTHLPKMVAKWREGHKIVQMVRQKTEGIGFFKNLFSNVFYSMINRLSEFPIVSGAADFQLLDQHVAKYLISTKGRQHFIRGTISWLGFNPATIEYTAMERHSGSASYSFWHSLKLAKVALFSMSKFPLRLGIYFGVFVALLCFLYIIYTIVMWFGGETIPGWASIMVMFLFVGAVQIIILGIIGEYIGQIYDSGRSLPAYVKYPEEDEHFWLEQKTDEPTDP